MQDLRLSLVSRATLDRAYFPTSSFVPHGLGIKSEGSAAAATGPVSLNLNGKRKNGPPDSAQLAGVGFVDFSDDLDGPEVEDDDDELIDEDTLLDEEDMKRPVVQRK